MKLPIDVAAQLLKIDSKNKIGHQTFVQNLLIGFAQNGLLQSRPCTNGVG